MYFLSLTYNTRVRVGPCYAKFDLYVMYVTTHDKVYDFKECQDVKGLFMLKLIIFYYDVCVYINKLQRIIYYIGG